MTAQDLHLPGDCRSALFAVFDGHGGRNAAEQAASLLPNHLRTLVAQAQQGLRYGKVSPALCYGGTLGDGQWRDRDIAGVPSTAGAAGTQPSRPWCLFR